MILEQRLFAGNPWVYGESQKAKNATDFTDFTD
jgi:hypothetical protein